MAARGRGVDCIVIAKVTYLLWQQWTWGLDCIAIAKVMWQQGVGGRLHCYCQSNVAASGRGLDCIVIAKVGPTVAARDGFTVLCYCQSNVAARGRGLDYIVIAKGLWQQGVGGRG